MLVFRQSGSVTTAGALAAFLRCSEKALISVLGGREKATHRPPVLQLLAAAAAAGSDLASTLV